jgi:hypothetical protein
MTIGITAVELEKEFLRWWKSDESGRWGGQQVYEMVPYPTAKALFFEGWIRAEEYFERKEDNEKGQK